MAGGHMENFKMPIMLLTELALKRSKKLRPGPKRVEWADEGCKGLYLIVQSSGVRSWAHRYNWKGRTVKATLGGYPALSLREARDLVAENKVLLSKGTDPRSKKLKW